MVGNWYSLKETSYFFFSSWTEMYVPSLHSLSAMISASRTDSSRSSISIRYTDKICPVCFNTACFKSGRTFSYSIE